MKVRDTCGFEAIGDLTDTPFLARFKPVFLESFLKNWVV